MKVRELYITGEGVRAYPEIVYSTLKFGNIITSRLDVGNISYF
jgi:hypothetical protein